MTAIPKAQSVLVDRQGFPTGVWYSYLKRLQASSSLTDAQQKQLDDLLVRINGLEDTEAIDLTVKAIGSIQVLGTPAGGMIQLSLQGDTTTPGSTWYYGAGQDGVRGWHPVSDSLSASAGELTKQVDADSGVSTFGLAEVPNAGGGTLQKTLRDGYGRVAGTSAATTDDLAEGDGSLYFTDERAAAAAPVQSINGKAGSLVLDFSDVGAERASAKLSALASGTYQPEVSGDNVDFAGSNPTEVSLGVKNTGGGTAVFHYYFKGGGSGSPGFPQLLGGAGSRPWSGTGYTAHSTAAYHLVTSEVHTSVAQGTDFGILATPVGGTHANRVYAGWFNGDGDFINSKGLTKRKINPLELGRGIEIVREGNTAEISMVSNYGVVSSSYSSLFRGYAIGGTIGSPTATTSGAGTGFALCGHDGVSILGAKAIFGLRATATWSASSTPARIDLETTAPGSTARTLRWQIADSGHFFPGADATYEVGSSAARPKQLWAVSGTINTSDAREKTAVRALTAAELAAAAEFGNEIGAYQWLAMVAEKGSGARQHIGMTVQRAIDVMESHGLDPFAYGFICYDEWDELPEIRSEDGEIVQKHRAADNRYSFRMDELLAFIARGLVHRLDAVEQRLAAAGL